MTNDTTRRILTGLCTILTVFALLVVNAAAQTSTTEKIKGASTTTSLQERGTVQFVEGNTVVLKMSTGEIRTVTVPDSRTATVDGQEINVHGLKVGTTLTATYTTTKTPVTERTVSNLTGRVWFVSGTTVILTLPDNTNKQYKARDDMKFIVNGQPATVFDLKKGMTVSAEKIVEAPLVEIASNTAITGHAPKAKAMAAQAAAPARESEPAPAATPAAAPAPTQQAAALPAKLPKTGSQLPLAALVGLLCLGASFGLRILRRS
jgi:LPXTG-motif cell wall-anchored protein